MKCDNTFDKIGLSKNPQNIFGYVFQKDQLTEIKGTFCLALVRHQIVSIDVWNVIFL